MFDSVVLPPTQSAAVAPSADIFIYSLHSPFLKAREPNLAAIRKLCSAASQKLHGAAVHHAVIDDHEAASLSSLSPEALKGLTETTPTNDIPEAYRPLLRPLHLPQVSNALKHHAALKRIAENAKTHAHAHHIILEDDALHNDDVLTMLRTTIEQRPTDADVIFLGMPSSKSGTLDRVVYEPLQNVVKLLPCCESYYVTPAAAQALAASFLPVRFATNVHLTLLIETLKLRAYVCSPTVFLDGSKLGVFVSTLDANNMLHWHPAYAQIRAIVSKPAPTLAELNQAAELLKAAHFKEHPDMRYMAALLHVHNKRFSDAKAEFERAFEVYVAEQCILGGESLFMRDMVNLYRHLQ